MVSSAPCPGPGEGEGGSFTVVCHGDLCWANILFRCAACCQYLRRMWIVTKVSRYDEAGEPKEVKFIDFQSSRLSSLVTDLLTLAFTSLSSSLRREHTDTMLEVSGHLHLHLHLSLVL